MSAASASFRISYPEAETRSKPEVGLLAFTTPFRRAAEAKLLRPPRPRLRGTWVIRKTFFICCSDKRLSDNREAMVVDCSTRTQISPMLRGKGRRKRKKGTASYGYQNVEV